MCAVCIKRQKKKYLIYSWFLSSIANGSGLGYFNHLWVYGNHLLLNMLHLFWITIIGYIILFCFKDSFILFIWFSVIRYINQIYNRRHNLVSKFKQKIFYCGFVNTYVTVDTVEHQIVLYLNLHARKWHGASKATQII